MFGLQVGSKDFPHKVALFQAPFDAYYGSFFLDNGGRSRRHSTNLCLGSSDPSRAAHEIFLGGPLSNVPAAPRVHASLI